MNILLRILRAISGFIFAFALIQLGFISIHITGSDVTLLSDFEVANIHGFALVRFLVLIIFGAVFFTLRSRINTLYSKKYPSHSLPIQEMWQI